MHSVEQCYIGKDSRVVDRGRSDEDVSEQASEAVPDHLGCDQEEDSPPSIELFAVVEFHC